MALYSPLLDSVSKLSTTRLPTVSASATQTLTGVAPIQTTLPEFQQTSKYSGFTTPTIAAPPPPVPPPPQPMIGAPPPPAPPPAPVPNIAAPPPPPAPTPTPVTSVAPKPAPTLTGVQGASIPTVPKPAVTLPQTLTPLPSLPGAVTTALQGQAPIGGITPTVRPLPEATVNTGTAPVIPRPAIQPPIPVENPADEGGPLQDFGPGNDLRGTQINPFTGERLRGVQDDTDVLFRALTQGPSLSQAALDQYRIFGEDQADERQQGIRSIGQAAARLGRLGSGMVTTDLGNLEERLGIADARERSRLASGLAFSEGNERRANLSAGQGFESQLYGQGRGLRDEARTERDFQENQARRAQDQEVLRRQLEVAYQQYLAQLGLQGAGLYGQQAAAGQKSAADLIAGVL